MTTRTAFVAVLLLLTSCARQVHTTTTPPPRYDDASEENESGNAIVYVRCYDSGSAASIGITATYHAVSFPTGGMLIDCSVSDGRTTSSWSVARPRPTDDEPLDTRCTVVHDIAGEPDGGFWRFQLDGEGRVRVDYVDAGEPPISFEIPVDRCGAGLM